MNTQNSKGNDLENAVEALERAILHSTPSLKDKDFTIEKRKIIIAGGVKHEIDVYITIDLGNRYDAIYIFECKNWEDKVGKNEIIIFSEKIKALGAQKGFFIANSFTKYANAQAKLDSRVHLLSVSNDKEVNMKIPNIIGLDQQVTHISVDAFEKGYESSKKLNEMDFNTLVFTVDGREHDFREYLKAMAKELMVEKLDTEPSATFLEGLYQYQEEKRYSFPNDNITINKTIISTLVLNVSFELRVIRPPILSKFNIETRGRIYTVKPIFFPSGGRMDSLFIQLKKGA